jgi:glycosyltransferase involved in cell wall biosynthesis
MKIYFDNVNWSSSSGPNYFAHQLATQVSYIGHIVADPNDYDVALVFIEPTYNLRFDKPCVQRLDGIWSKPEDFVNKNKTIKALYHHCNHVIWQSDFDRNMTVKWWYNPRQGTVIRNGTLASKVTTNREALLDMREKYAKIFVCSASWHGQKRLTDNIRLFKHIRSTIEHNSCLIVMGENTNIESELVRNQPIFFTGNLDPSICLEIFSVTDWMIHLAYGDHSPNVILQALSQGCPVICSEVGGSCELVMENGVTLKDAAYNYELFDYDAPPPIDITQLTHLPKITVDAPYIRMEEVAKQYIEVLQSVLQ